MKKINCILLIDDNPADNEFHTIKIKKADVCNHIKIATDGIKALEYIKNSAIPGQENEFPKANLIFLDINMPRMNGFEFMMEYEKLDEQIKATIVIVMLTTSINLNDMKMAMDNKEIIEFRNKPLTVEMIYEIIEKYF